MAFETGDIDLLYGNEGLYRSIPSPALARTRLTTPNCHADRNRDAGTQYRQSPHQRAGVREALNYAVNKKSLIDNALLAPSRSPTPCLPLLCPTPTSPETAPVRSAESESVAGKSRLTLPAGKDIREKNGQPLRIERRSSAPMR